ncbi:Ethylene-regulated transcript 2 [Hirschfeldia incana]|nr:Ethylene-regulated transcript 2 [Hirschfeldia incana]
MPLPWKKSKSGRISKFVTDLQQSPKHGGSLVVETGFPTSLIHLFFKNRDRLKKSSSKRNSNRAQAPTAPSLSLPTPRQRVPSLPPPHSLPPQKHDPASVTEDHHLPASKIEDVSVGGDGGLTSDEGNCDGGGGGCCVLMVVAIKVFVVAVLALSTKKLAVGITISAFALLFLEFAVPRVLTLLNFCPNAQVRLDSLIRKHIGKNLESSSPPPPSSERTRNNVSFEIIETFQEPRDCIEEETPEPSEKKEPVEAEEEREVLTIRDVVFTKEKSKSAKLKSKIVKKIVPKKLRSYKKKKKLKKMKEKEEAEGVEIEIFEEGEESSTTEASSLYSEDVTESEISERYEIGSNPPLLESCEEEEEEEERAKGDLTKAMVMMVIALAGLLGGKVLAIVLTVSSCLFLRLVCSKSQN